MSFFDQIGHMTTKSAICWNHYKAILFKKEIKVFFINTENNFSSLQDRKADKRIDAHQVVVSLDAAITVLAPAAAPTVSNHPVVNAILAAPANQHNRVVQSLLVWI